MKHSDKPLFKETMRKLQLLPGIEPQPQGWESTTLTTAPIPLTVLVFYIYVMSQNLFIKRTVYHNVQYCDTSIKIAVEPFVLC